MSPARRYRVVTSSSSHLASAGRNRNVVHKRLAGLGPGARASLPPTLALLDLGHAAEALELEDFLLLGLLRCLHVTRGLGVGCTGCAGWELRLAELAELAES